MVSPRSQGRLQTYEVGLTSKLPVFPLPPTCPRFNLYSCQPERSTVVAVLLTFLLFTKLIEIQVDCIKGLLLWNVLYTISMEDNRNF